MNPRSNGPRFTLCATYKAAARAAEELSRHDTLILDCEGRELGWPGGALSIIAIGDSTASRIFLFDTLSLSDKRHPLLLPLFALLRRSDVVKVVWDGRSDFLEIAGTYGVYMEGVLDLQLVEVAQRARRGHNKKGGRRAKHTVDYFKKLKGEPLAAFDGIHRLFGLEQCAGFYQLLHGNGGKDPAVTAMHQENQSDMWMQRPLPPPLLRYSAHDIEMIALVYDRFGPGKQGNYLKPFQELMAMSARYMQAYPTRELRALHVPLDLCRFLPLDVLTAPPAGGARYRCARCERMLSLPCFLTTHVQATPAGSRGRGGASNSQPLVRLSLCRLCDLLARRNAERIVREWIEI
ncbi:ribonuclease H-like domain-containing protein [Ganoderma leucocontextum]|nr:ribonuclease H-like domain-containing protein [Ganoderma leucocontextum]